MPSDEDFGALEKVRERLYEPKPLTPGSVQKNVPKPLSDMPHAWQDDPTMLHPVKRQVRFAAIFFGVAFAFFLIAAGTAGYFLYFGGNSVSTDNITIDIQGPTTIAGGDTVPLSLTIINKNPIAIKDATIEVDFPESTRDATDVSKPYPHYIEKLGTLESGATLTRSIKAVVFGGAGETLSLPISLSYNVSGSNSVFVKKASYPLSISSTPLSVSIDAQSEVVSGKPLTLTLTVRSNSNIPIDNVAVVGTYPFGFQATGASVPRTNTSLYVGKLEPGSSKTITLTGVLTGQDTEQRVFHFSVGTEHSSNDQALAVTYMTQDATISIAAPFISTTLALNGDTSSNVTLPAGSRQSVTVSFANTLATSVSNVTISVALSGNAVDYNSVQTNNGFYQSNDHTIVFTGDTDRALATLAPGASGTGTFTFSTLSAGSVGSSPSVTFTVSVSGTRVGESNVPEAINASMTKEVRVATGVALSASSLHTSGPIVSGGPIPPVVGKATTYTIVWNVHNQGSPLAGNMVTATLPSYVTFTGKTSGSGTFSYDSGSRTVSWNAGEVSQGASAEGAFQVSFTPSSSQRGSAPYLTSRASFTGHDRFAGVDITTTAEPVSTDTRGDQGYNSANGTVQ